MGPRTEVLGYSQPSLRDSRRFSARWGPRTEVLGYSRPSLRDSRRFSARGGPRTEVLGYSQPSLRDEESVISGQTLIAAINPVSAVRGLYASDRIRRAQKDGRITYEIR